MAPNACGINPYYVFDYWSTTALESDTVELTIFMPNGIVLMINTHKTATLAEVKEVSRRSQMAVDYYLVAFYLIIIIIYGYC